MIISYHSPKNPCSDDTEGHIERAIIELGHTVVKEDSGSDFVLFHKVFPETDAKKVCWYFDKISWKNRANYIQMCLEKADLVFVTDETWAKEHPHKKLKILRQGCGDCSKGRKMLINTQVAFTGSLYGERFNWFTRLNRRYKEKFYGFNNVFNKSLNNLCASVPIFVAPKDPSDDYYWSSRVYITLGSGGFLIHPYLEGLRKEYSEEELVMYTDEEDLYKKIDYYLAHPVDRERIRIKGWEKTKNNFTYKDRVCSLIAIVQKELKGKES